jgi:hypothetical protein
MKTSNETFKTKFVLEKEAKDRAVYNEWNELMAQPGAMSGAVGKYLCEKYGIYRTDTIRVIVSRVRKRLEAEGKC